MIQFVFMLTHHDATVADPLTVYRELAGTGLRYVGFKDIGVPVEQLRDVCQAAHDDGLEVMLEVVSTTLDEELRSAEAGTQIGVDWLLGGTNPAHVLPVIAGAAARYCPFPGTIVGHPSVLHGEITEIAESGRAITAMDGVYGLDLLAYRHPSADVAALTRAVVDAANGPVIAAGSVASVAQIQTLDAAGAWGFTIGGAIFENRLPGGPSVGGQVREVLRATVARGTAPRDSAVRGGSAVRGDPVLPGDAVMPGGSDRRGDSVPGDATTG